MGGSRFWSIAALCVGGIIIADVIAHPGGTAAASAGAANILTPTYNAMLGTTSKTAAKT